jgi:hypothetical protein
MIGRKSVQITAVIHLIGVIIALIVTTSAMILKSIQWIVKIILVNWRTIVMI